MFYRLARVFIKSIIKVTFNPEVVGLENVPKSGSLILAGNHTDNLDCLLLISTIERPIHFLGKHTLFKGIKKYLFRAMKVIPVDRTKKRNREAIASSIEVLKKGEILGIFPEGTINKTSKPVLPFKMGVVYLSAKTTSNIVPFIITGKFKKKENLKIEFLAPYIVKTGDLVRENEDLMYKIGSILLEDKK